MRNFKLLLLLSSFCFLFACGEDGLSDTSADDIIGDWTAVAVESNVETEIDILGVKSKTIAALQGTNINYDMSLNGSMFVTSGSYELEGSLNIEGIGSTPISENFSNLSSSGSYTVSGNQFIAKGDFFRVNIDGVDVGEQTQDQSSTFGINDRGQLVIILEDVLVTEDEGLKSTVTMFSSSTWEKI